LAVIPTDANFFLVTLESETEALQIYNDLLRRGVIIRPLRAFGIPHGLRITIGTPDQNNVLLSALKATLPVHQA
jgi:histidinol-phosphate aminotransferase